MAREKLIFYCVYSFIPGSYNGREVIEWGEIMWGTVWGIVGIALVFILIFDYCALVISKGEIHKRRKKEEKNKNYRL